VIYIDRDRLDSLGQTIRPSAGWFRLSATNEETAIQEKESHEARADVYGHLEARAALQALFHKKCAYCEVSISNRMGWNVDHYRPKGRIAERSTDHPGYYWLAYRWSNLYPACEDCNKKLVDTPTFYDHSTGPAAGKFDQFPLADESTRAMKPEDDLARETRLLLDPCTDSPEEVLRYDIDGDIYSKDDDAVGEATIQVLNLKRKRLRDNRKRWLSAFCDLYQIYVRHRTKGDEESATNCREFMERHYLADSAEHAAVARLIDSDPIAFGLTPA
jgi:uncharacterized protein (TIGR02646 family)